MKKRYSAIIVAIMLSAAAHADGWTFMAAGGKDYNPEPTLSLMAGQMSVTTRDINDGALTGIELSLNCPLLQPPTNRIRQQLSLTRYDKAKVRITSVELNPHYLVNVAPGLELGGGPGLAYIMVDMPGKNPDFWGLNIGLSAHYTGIAPLFVGAEYRYQVTTKEDFGVATGRDTLDNSRIIIKVGYGF